MKVIIPMSGIGSRFLRAGYKNIKPLIEVEGKPIIEHVVDMFGDEQDFIFICNKDHLSQTNLSDVLKRLKPNSEIIPIDRHKLGPVYAVLAANFFVDSDQPVIVNYCDFSVYWDYSDFKKTITENNCDGCVSAYRGFHPHLLGEGFYAGMRADSQNNMLEIREKHSFTGNKMDSFHSAGTYYFKKFSYLKKYFKQLIDKDMNINGEYYASTVYQLMKKDGLNIYIYDLEHFMQWGTPQDLDEYRYWSEYFHDKFKAKVRV